MIKVTEKAMAEICHKLSIDEKELEFIGGGREDSDGSVYTYNSGSGKMVLKILAIPEDHYERVIGKEITELSDILEIKEALIQLFTK